MTVGIVVLLGLAVLAGIYLVLRTDGARNAPSRDRTEPDEGAGSD